MRFTHWLKQLRGKRQGEHERAEEPARDHQPPGDRRPEITLANPVRIEPAADEQQWRAEQRAVWKRQISATVWLNWVTGAAGGAAFLALILLYRTEIDARTQAQAALTAAQTAQQQLTLSERPWIKISHRIVKPLTFDTPASNGNGSGLVAEVIIEDTLENVGPSVALNVLVWEEIIPMGRMDYVTYPGQATFHAALAHQSQRCDANRHPNSQQISGYMLFPHDPDVGNEPVDLSMEQVTKAVASSPVEGKVALVMVGCVSYRIPFESADAPRHETKFMYTLGKPEANGILAFITPVGVNPEIQLVKFGEGLSAD